MGRIYWLLLGAVFVILAINFLPFFKKQVTYSREGEPHTLSVVEKEALPENWLSIPVIRVGSPIVYVDEKNEEVYQSALKDGVVHYPETALPGELGNMYVFGHSSDLIWNGGDYKTIFALLPKLREGDEIIVTNTKKDVFTYIVTETFTVNPSDMSVLDQFNDEKSLLTIQTSYPLGTALRRYIVRAELDQDQDSSAENDE